MVLIDNSSSSINGDFFPTRLQAQKITTSRFAQFLFSVAEGSRVAVGTLSSTEFGIRMSFTRSAPRVEEGLTQFTSGGPYMHLAKGIRCAVLALKQCLEDRHVHRRILAFVASENDVTDISIAREVSALLDREDIVLDIVVFGSDVCNIDILRELVPERHRIHTSRGSVFLVVPSSDTMLSDDVLSSSIGPGPQTHGHIPEGIRNDMINEVRARRESSMTYVVRGNDVRSSRAATCQIVRVRKPAGERARRRPGITHKQDDDVDQEARKDPSPQ